LLRLLSVLCDGGQLGRQLCVPLLRSSSRLQAPRAHAHTRTHTHMHT
jgi:hypothetical protein